MWKIFDKKTYKKIKDALNSQGYFKGEATVIRESGDRILTLLSINTINPQKGMKGYRVAIVSDINRASKSQERRYIIQVHTSFGQGLPNRKFI